MNTINQNKIKHAYDSGSRKGDVTTLNHSLDYYDNYRHIHLTLTYQIALNPYSCRVGNFGKKLKAAWHNGFLSTVKHPKRKRKDND